MDGGAEQQRHDAEWRGASVSSLDSGDAVDDIRPWHCERWRGRQLTDVRGLTSRHVCISRHAQQPFDLLHTYCHIATSAAIKRERVDGFLQSKAYMNP